ncbi:MAG: tRNA lysidine(34) synthetase TilS [Spirochaetales bacterium]|nr:tRNA lysidine(34) synthetase TilS [Spirochaetales bacterium]MCF7938000.1 tRNA lysidine(34) synthetase TilS [Spirochaetales bacterium]
MKSIVEKIHKQAAYVLREETGAVLVVALSAGPDSTALLYILSELALQHHLRLVPAHYSHDIREAAEHQADEDLARQICSELGLEFRFGRAGKGAIEAEAARSGKGIEAAARMFRYSFLEKVGSESGADFIATGHTLDDHLETLVMRFFQGSGAAGLSGIEARRGRYLRPLIGIEKAELIRYLQERNIPYREDRSNRDERFLRNKVRHRLLPVVEEVFPGYRRSLAAGSIKQSVAADFLQKEAEKLEIEEDAHGVSVKMADYAQLPAAVRLETAYRIIDRFDTGGSRIPFRALQILLDDEAVRRRAVLIDEAGIRCERRGERLWWGADIVTKGQSGYCIVVQPGKRYRLPVAGDEADIEIPSAGDLKYSDSNGPLVLRSLMTGDRIRTGGGEKKLTTYFAERGIPAHLRRFVPVLQDRQGIIACFGNVIGYEYITGVR